MDTTSSFGILTLFLLIVMCYGLQEYCLRETVNITCPHQEVILINTAQYGRMERGKCVTSDRDLSCFIDATSYLNEKCAEKPSCEYYVRELLNTKPCESDGESYLLMDYTCIKVARSPNGEACSVRMHTKLQDAYGYISSRVAREQGVGTIQCPWRIEALPGQGIAISVISLGALVQHNSRKTIGFISESIFSRNTTIYQPDTRQQHVLASNGHVVDIQLIPTNVNTLGFLVEYEVTGCADVLAPDHAWHKREGNVATVGCKHQNKTWHLRCDGSQWSGVVGICDEHGVLTTPQSNEDWDSLPDPVSSKALVLIVIIGVIIIVALCSCTIIIKCCDHKSQPSQEQCRQIETNAAPPNYGPAPPQAQQMSSWAGTPRGDPHAGPHIWQTPLPQPQGGVYELPPGVREEWNPSNRMLGQEIPRAPHAWSHPHMERGRALHSMPNIVEYSLAINEQTPQNDHGTKPKYTMPARTERIVRTFNPCFSDYTISGLPQPVPVAPDSDLGFTVPPSRPMPGNHDKP